MAEAKDSFDKPTFDGRLQYHQVLKAFVLDISRASYGADFNGWKRLARQMFSFVRGFIKESDANIIKEKLERVSSDLTKLNNAANRADVIILQNRVDNKLQDITDVLFIASKHLFLTTRSDEEDIFDMEDFKRGSDL